MIVSLPLPGMAEASTKSTSPPTGVHASPVATPGSAVRRRTSGWKRGRPSSSRTRGAVIDILRSSVPSATSSATLRHAAPISRSRLRTPASRVYEPMIAFRPASLNATCERLSPLRSIWRGTR